MLTIKEKLEEIDRKSPIGKCDCINSHHKGVMLVAIDYMINSRKSQIEEIKRKTPEIKRMTIPGEPMPSYYPLRVFENEILNLDTTRKKLLMIPDCPD